MKFFYDILTRVTTSMKGKLNKSWKQKFMLTNNNEFNIILKSEEIFHKFFQILKESPCNFVNNSIPK